ncbi:hypothetical protein ABPG74_018334 [Tetrahymena malaccensis]
MSNQQEQASQQDSIQETDQQQDLLNNVADINKNVNQIQNSFEDSENLTERQLFIIKTYFSSFNSVDFSDVQKYLFFEIFINFDQVQDKLNEYGYEIGVCLEICGESLIFEGVQKQSEKNIILKIIPSEEKEDMKDQINILNQLKDSNRFVKIIDQFNVKEEIYIFAMEKCQQSLKQELIQMQTQRQFPEEKLIKMIFNLLHGLIDLHEKNILHLDLKLPNVLLSQDGNYIITDFGASQIKQKGKTMVCGQYTKSTSPIEQQIDEQNNQIDFKSDVYSLGMALLKILELFQKVKRGSQIIKFAEQIELIIRAYMTQQDQYYRENCFSIHNRFYKQFQKIKKLVQQEKWFEEINNEIEQYNEKINNQQHQNVALEQKNQQIEQFFEEIEDDLQQKKKQILEEQINGKLIKLETCSKVKEQIQMLINGILSENQEQHLEENQINSQNSTLQISYSNENKENIQANSSAQNEQIKLITNRQTSDKPLGEIEILDQQNIQNSFETNSNQKEANQLDLQNLEQIKVKKAIDIFQIWINEQIEQVKSGDQASQKQFLDSFIKGNLKFQNINHLQQLIDQITINEEKNIHLNEV